jgi:AcrR family transcriptional regulator
MNVVSPTRAEQRRQTEERILHEARSLFAELGFERTTIRAVAAAAGVDGGLVMHYFGSKQELFLRVTRVEADQLLGDDPVEALLASLATRLTAEPTASLAVLRSILTNDDAAATYRTAAAAHLARLGAAIPTPDSALRASLLTAITHGVLTERYLLRLGPLSDAPATEVLALLRPVLEALVRETSPMLPDEVRALAYRLHEAFNTRDFARADEVLAADFHSHPLGTVGPGAVKASWAAMVAQHPDTRTVVEDVLVDGDRAAIRSTVHGLRAGGPPPEIMEIFRAADGRIAELWGVTNLRR